MSGQCRCTADGGRDGSAAAGMETPGPTAHALCSWESHVGCRRVVPFVRPLLGHCRRVDGVWSHESLVVGRVLPFSSGWYGKGFSGLGRVLLSHRGR